MLKTLHKKTGDQLTSFCLFLIEKLFLNESKGSCFTIGSKVYKVTSFL